MNCTPEVMKSCAYGSGMRHNGVRVGVCCEYILKTGKRRPCPATDCTCYKKRGVK